jgi:hypothetical protein
MGMFPDDFPFNKPLTMPAATTTSATVSPIDDETEVAPAPAPLSPADAMIAAAVTAQGGRPAKERRRSPRQSLAAKATLRIDSSTAPMRRVALLNLSMLGARFTAAQPFGVGDKATLRFEVGPLRWSSRLQVVNCIQQRDGNFAIGAEFVGNELSRQSIAA